MTKPSEELYWACARWDEKAQKWLPDIRTLALTIAGSVRLADTHMGRSPYARRKQGYRVIPYRLTAAMLPEAPPTLDDMREERFPLRPPPPLPSVPLKKGT